MFFDGATHWLADGFHRYFGADHAGLEEIAADVRTGTQSDAQLYSFSVNSDHGLRRSNADKRKAVNGALAHPVSSKWSDNAIAKHCGVDHKTVAAVRVSHLGNSQVTPQERTYTTKHGTTAVMNTANIGQAIPRRDPPTLPAATPAAPPAAPKPAAPVAVVEPEAEAPPEYTELDALRDRCSELLANNDELRNELAARCMGSTEEEQQQAAERFASLQAELNTERASNRALTVLHQTNMYQIAEMKRQLKSQRDAIARLSNKK